MENILFSFENALRNGSKKSSEELFKKFNLLSGKSKFEKELIGEIVPSIQKKGIYGLSKDDFSRLFYASFSLEKLISRDNQVLLRDAHLNYIFNDFMQRLDELDIAKLSARDTWTLTDLVYKGNSPLNISSSQFSKITGFRPGLLNEYNEKRVIDFKSKNSQLYLDNLLKFGFFENFEFESQDKIIARNKAKYLIRKNKHKRSFVWIDSLKEWNNKKNCQISGKVFYLI